MHDNPSHPLSNIGAKFYVKVFPEKKRKVMYHVWYNSSERSLYFAYSKGQKPYVTIKVVEIAAIRIAKDGLTTRLPSLHGSLVPENDTAKSPDIGKNGFVIDQLFTEKSYHLEIPRHGNGRSREEWTGAIRSLVAGAEIS